MTDKSPRYNTGMKTRRQVLGDEYVDRASAGIDEFNEPFQEFVTEGPWGHVWSGDAWSKRERSMVTVALLAALGHGEELEMHIRACRKTGATKADIREALMHVAVYAGFPAANNAYKIARRIFQETEHNKGE